jgi:hypothetical protein
MTALGKKTIAWLAGAALSLAVTPAIARGGHGGGGRGGGRFGGGAHFGGAPHYSAPVHAAPHYSAPAYRGPSPGMHYSTPTRGYGYAHGYLGGGRGAYVVGGRVPAFYGGPRGHVWWGPGYGWRVPAYWGGYYRPYGAYWGLGFWVTDWIMLDYLAAEEARMMAYGGPAVVAVPVESAPLDGGVREELREQITEDLANSTPPAKDTSAAGNTLVVADARVAGALAAQHHVFIVSQATTVTDRATGGACNLTQADLLRSSAPVPSGQSNADVTVAASKKGSCAPGAVVSIPVAELVRFEEALLERVAQGAAAANATETEPAPGPAPNAPSDAPQDMSTPTAPPPTAGAMSL